MNSIVPMFVGEINSGALKMLDFFFSLGIKRSRKKNMDFWNKGDVILENHVVNQRASTSMAKDPRLIKPK